MRLMLTLVFVSNCFNKIHWSIFLHFTIHTLNVASAAQSSTTTSTAQNTITSSKTQGPTGTYTPHSSTGLSTTQSPATQSTTAGTTKPPFAIHTYYLSLPHTTNDLAIYPNVNLTAYIDIRGETSTNTQVNITVQHPTLSTHTLIVNSSAFQQFYLDSSLTHQDTGRSKRGVKVIAVYCVHVTLYTILTQDKGQIESATASYIYPSFMLHNEYMIVTHYTEYKYRTARLIVVSTENRNTVNLRFASRESIQPINFIINGTRVIAPDSLSVTLDQSGVFFLETLGDLTGSKVISTYKVAVFMSLNELKNDISFEQLLPATNQWDPLNVWTHGVSLSGLTGRTEAVYVVASVYDTNVLWIGNKSNMYTFEKAGDSNFFSVLNHVAINPTKATSVLKFLRGKTTLNRTVACISSVPHPSVWRNSYVWQISQQFLNNKITITIRKAYTSFLKLNGVNFQEDEKQDVDSASDYIVLTKTNVTIGLHTIKTSNSSMKFHLQIYVALGNGMLCTTVYFDHSPGNISIFDKPPIDNNFVYKSTTVFPQSKLNSTTELIVNVTEETELTTPVNNSISTLGTTVIYDHTLASSHPAEQREMILNCLERVVFLKTIENLTVNEVKVIADKVKHELTVDVKNMSANQRKLISVVDARSSSAWLGVLGVALITLVFVFIVIGDVIRVCVWLWGLARI